ncbi:MAG: transglutaminase domain-containing protein, partial [Lachnospiraceae bacterium]|nr:transglutaminase domain-containing protein [Lachnospiraceae bacterium]
MIKIFDLSINKYRTICAALIIALICPLLSGCADALSFDKSGETSRISLDENVASDMIIVEKVEELDLDSDDTKDNLPDKDLSKASEELVKSDGLKYYHYDLLSDEDKVLYTEIYSIISNLSKDTKVSSKDPDKIEKAFSYVMLDHPELFYLTGYSFTKYMRGNRIEKITLSGNYTMTKNEADSKKLLVDSYVDKCIEGYDGYVDDYEKVKYVYEYLIKNTEYDMSVANNQNVLSVVVDNRTVCQGYAKAMQLILNRMGVFCILCEGVVKGTESHVWNIVRINDKYYHVDATWGDASYMIEDTSGQFEAPDINYDYLCVTDEEITKTHVIKDGITYPVCSSMDDNYYVREGLYLTEINSDVIMNAFNNARENNERIVTLKCENANVYTALYKHLIENQNIFDYLNGA